MHSSQSLLNWHSFTSAQVDYSLSKKTNWRSGWSRENKRRREPHFHCFEPLKHPLMDLAFTSGPPAQTRRFPHGNYRELIFVHGNHRDECLSLNYSRRPEVCCRVLTCFKLRKVRMHAWQHLFKTLTFLSKRK